MCTVYLTGVLGSTQNKLLSLLRLCGGPVIAESPAVKVKLAEDMWQMMIEKGMYVVVKQVGGVMFESEQVMSQTSVSTISCCVFTITTTIK